MGRSGLTLLLAAVAAIVLGVLGSNAIANAATPTLSEAASSVTDADVAKPATYGKR
jgi:hypothetical protein